MTVAYAITPRESELTARRIVNALGHYAYRFRDEVQLHRGLAAALTAEGIAFEREHVIGADRFDFICQEHVVIEAKIGGSASEALRQVDRYCAHDTVHAAVIVNARSWRSSPASTVLRGRPVHFVHVRGQSF